MDEARIPACWQDQLLEGSTSWQTQGKTSLASPRQATPSRHSIHSSLTLHLLKNMFSRDSAQVKVCHRLGIWMQAKHPLTSSMPQEMRSLSSCHNLSMIINCGSTFKTA